MASPANGQELEPVPSQQPVKQQQAETSTTTPAQGSPDERKKAFGLQPGDEKLLLKVYQDFKREWTIPRRQTIRDTLRHIEYSKGNQYIVWDPFTTTYQPYSSAVSSSAAGVQGSEQGTDSVQYQCEVNVIQWLERVFNSTLGASIPDVEWWPGDSESDIDNRAAMARGRAYQKIASDNKSKDFLDQCLSHFFLTGSYFRHIRWSMDKTVTGTHYEDVYGWQDQVLSPDRYECPSCGATTPANIQNIQRQTPCVGCGRPMTSADFHQAVTVKMPVVTGQKEVPNGQVRWDTFNLLNVEVMPTASSNGPGVIGNTPILDKSLDIVKGVFRKMYPDKATWDLINTAQTDNANSDAELSRLARQRTMTPGNFRMTTTMQGIITPHWVYFTPESINQIDNQVQAQRLADTIGEGAVATIVNDQMIDIQPAVLRKEWTWCGARKNVGAYPPAPVKVAMPFQDRINDRTNAVDEFHDRCGNPPIFYSELQLGEAMNGKTMLPGTLIPIPVNSEIGQNLANAFFQPKFTMDNGVYQWIKELFDYVQLLVGILPQTYGGSNPDIKTKGGQEQALKTAQGVLWLNWNQLRGEWTEAANLSVDCFATNATQDEYDVVKDDDAPDFQNEPIRLADLSGKAVAKAEANQDYPIGYEQQRELFQQLLGFANGKEPNPLVMEMLDTYENRRVALRFVGTPDMELPETAARYKVLNDIQVLTQGGPTPVEVMGQDPQTGMPVPQTIQKPTVEPDKDFDNLDVLTETVIRYVQKHFKELTGTPALDNLRAYLAIATQYQQQKAIEGQAAQQLLSAGAPGWGGDLGGPMQKAAPAAAPA